ncbi:MAG: hypothetical protein Q8P31_05175 [Bacillota bacterium]|nr:hypothetical protein [Bacillota bacterium]
MQGFWNDPDGISITDFLALGFSLAYMVLLALTLWRMIAGKLEPTDIDFLQVVTWPTLTILGGYFGGQMLGRLGKGSPNTVYPSQIPLGPDAFPAYDGTGRGPLLLLDPRLPIDPSRWPGAVETIGELTPEDMGDAPRG